MLLLMVDDDLVLHFFLFLDLGGSDETEDSSPSSIRWRWACHDVLQLTTVDGNVRRIAMGTHHES